MEPLNQEINQALQPNHIQTAGSSYGRYPTTEGRLPGLSIEEAEKLRDELLVKARQSRGQGL